MSSFTHLVDTGKYSKDMLSNGQRERIEGMEEAEELIDSFESFFIDYFDLSEEVVLDKIRLDCMEETMGAFRDYLHSEICERIVTLVDQEGKE